MGSFITFEYISSFLAILVAFILLWINQNQRHGNRMLAVVLICFALANFNSGVLYSGLFLQFPLFHKMTLPFTLLIAPAAYLYVRTILNGEIKFQSTDWVLSIPALLYTINMIPYYVLPLDVKKAHMSELYVNSALNAQFSEGILPAYVFSFLRIAWSVLFIFLNYRLIRRFRKNGSARLVNDNQALLKWLSVFNSMLAGLLVITLANALTSAFAKTSILYTDIAAGFLSMFISLQLFIRPKLLYGIFEPTMISDIESTTPIKAFDNVGRISVPIELGTHQMHNIKESIEAQLIISQSDSYRYKKTVETFFAQHKPYLNTGYSLELLVTDSKIPRYLLSAFINREYRVGFREFLNRYRVDYFKDNFNNVGWEHLTLEAIAFKCGFSSRSSFIAHVKLVTMQTPSEYIKGKGRESKTA